MKIFKRIVCKNRPRRPLGLLVTGHDERKGGNIYCLSSLINLKNY